MRENSSMESPSEAAGSGELDWNTRYLSGDTPWDHGKAHPELVHWLTENRFSGEVIVPGCGKGYDVFALAKSGVSALGVDISTEAIKLAKQAGLMPDAHFQVADVLHPPKEWEGRFHGVFEHTCYCAIPPAARPTYALSLATIIRPRGIFLACFYMNPEADTGPPFPTGRKELDRLFKPYFRLRREWVPSHTYSNRKGRELFRVYIAKRL